MEQTADASSEKIAENSLCFKENRPYSGLEPFDQDVQIITCFVQKSKGNTGIIFFPCDQRRPKKAARWLPRGIAASKEKSGRSEKKVAIRPPAMYNIINFCDNGREDIFD